MSYQVLARKWRPQDFSSVVGQVPIVRALRNALEERRIAQAYLFSGIRGVGKTSVARVLAKALNCEKGPRPDPCNECVPCLEITAGSDLDVIEVDAATYSKVEQVRELTESLKYGPARDRYKVVVIDEIHRLSRQAFDALLKIVEEPPPHLVFIFATTESEAVPATILSRCQEFHFRRVPPAPLTEYLRRIAEAEEITASDTALRLVARAGEGSVRDAVALLDQLATYGSGSIPDDEAARILGGVDTSVHRRILAAVLDGRGSEIAAVVAEIEDQGWDPRHVYAEFLGYCRDALHLSLGAGADQIDLPLAEAEELAALVADAGYENLLRLLHQLLGSEPAVRRSESASLALEIALLRAAELPKLTRIEELLGGGAPGAGPREKEPTARGPKRGASRAGSKARSGAEAPPAPAEPASEPSRETGTTAERPTVEAAPRTEDPRPRAHRASTADPAVEPTEASETAIPEPALSEVPTLEVDNHEATKDEAAAPEATAPEAAEPETAAHETAGPETAAPETPALDPPPSEAAVSGAATAKAGAGAPQAPQAPQAADVPTATGENGSVARFLDLVSQSKQPLAAHLSDAISLVFVDGELQIHAPPEDSWLQRALSRAPNREVLDRCLSDAFGSGSRWRLIETEAERAKPEAKEPEPTEPDPALEHPLVQTALDIFGGSARKVGESASERDD